VNKSFAKVLMYVTGCYALLGYSFLMLWFIGVMSNLLFGEVTFLPAFLPNAMSMLEQLLTSGSVGLITLMVLVGQFFFAYHASNVFKRLSSIDLPYSKNEKEEYLTYLILVAILIIYLI